MAHVDPYRAVHQGTRALLAQAREAVRRARSDHAELPEAAAALRRLDRLLRAEACRHDEHVLPHLARLAPVLAAELETRYDRCEGLGDEVARRLDRLGGASPAERASLVARLEGLADALVAEHEGRLELELERAARVLAEHLGEPGLCQLERDLDGAPSSPEHDERLELLRAGDLAADGAAGASERRAS